MYLLHPLVSLSTLLLRLLGDASSFSEQSFFVKDTITLRKSAEVSPKQFDADILCQPSASSPNGPEPPLVLITVLCTSLAVMSLYLIG